MDDQEQRTKELWERLTNEPANAFAAFACFDSLDARKRSVLAAYRLSVRPDARKPSDTWTKWAKDFAWADRSLAHDRHMDAIRREGVDEALKSEAKRHAKLVEKMRYQTQEELTVLHDGLMEYLQNLNWNPDRIRMQDVIQIIKLRVEATMRFEETNPSREDTQEAGVDWSLDAEEFANSVVADILAEAEEEETPDEDEEHSGENSL